MSKLFLAVILVLAMLFVYFQVFAIPNIPQFAGGDEGIYLHHGSRMLRGQLIYRDYDHFTFPATDTFYMAVFRVFGVRAWIRPAMLVVLGGSLFWVGFQISRRVLGGKLALLPGALFLTLAFSGYLDATHWWYSTVASMSGLAILMERQTTKRLLWSGMLWGLATCFTQSSAVGALGIVFFLLWERARANGSWKMLLNKEAVFLGALSATVVAFLAYFVLEAGLTRFIHYAIVFVIQYYPADRFNTWRAYLAGRPPLRDWTRWPDLAAFWVSYLLIPLVYVLFLARFRTEAQRHPLEPWKQLMLVNLVGLFSFLSILPSAGYMRVYAVSLPAFVLLAWFLRSPSKIQTTLQVASWAAVLVLALARPVLIQTHWKARLNLPTGETVFLDRARYEEYKWLSERTQPGDYFVGDAHICFALDLRNPTRVPFLRPTDYTRPEEVENVLEALSNYPVNYVSWYHGLDAAPALAHDHLGPLRLFLQEHYFVAQTFSNGDLIWQRRETTRVPPPGGRPE